MTSHDGQLTSGKRDSQEAFHVWGLTGGIASGKSTVARLFAEAGLPVIDADQIARDLSAPGGRAHATILQRFGTADRAKLREKVFADAAARRDLEAILHPLIRAESYNRMRQASKKFAGGPSSAPIIYEAALLIEAGRHKDMSGVIVVEAPRELRLKRLIERDGHSPELAEKILGAQLSDDERRKAATHVIVNAGSLDELRARVAEILSKIS